MVQFGALKFAKVGQKNDRIGEEAVVDGEENGTGINPRRVS